jgi:RNA polymerase sigma-70 factor (sigma-E family)
MEAAMNPQVVDGAFVADELLPGLYTAQWGPMVRLAALLLGSTAQAEEVVQEAFVGVYRKRSRLRGPDAAGAYLRRSVVNGCRSAQRHAAVEVRRRPPPPPAPGEPEDLVLERAEHSDVIAALRTLPTRQQEVLVLKYYLDASEADTASMLGVSRGSVKTHTSRGLAALRARLLGSTNGSDDHA